jgi:hypothetical protein
MTTTGGAPLSSSASDNVRPRTGCTRVTAKAEAVISDPRATSTGPASLMTFSDRVRAAASVSNEVSSRFQRSKS